MHLVIKRANRFGLFLFRFKSSNFDETRQRSQFLHLSMKMKKTITFLSAKGCFPTFLRALHQKNFPGGKSPDPHIPKDYLWNRLLWQILVSWWHRCLVCKHLPPFNFTSTSMSHSQSSSAVYGPAHFWNQVDLSFFFY